MSNIDSPQSLGDRRRPGTSPLSLDLSSLPPLSQPSPPSNTLLITGLRDLTLFQPPSSDTIKSKITSIAPLNSYSPLPSLRRIICSFLTVDDAVKVRQILDREPLIPGKSLAKVYFGETTPIQGEDDECDRNKKLLGAPLPDKMFFISPPPSPPHGWMMRNEEPPNKEVHAADLVNALNNLNSSFGGDSDHIMGNTSTENKERFPESPVSPTDATSAGTNLRRRSSTLIYHPEHHGNSPNLPAVTVEDTSMDDLEDSGDVDIPPKKIFAHTARPPTELMD